MIARMATVLALALILLGVARASHATAQNGPVGPLEPEMAADGVTWKDQDREVEHRIFGSVSYFPPASCASGADILSETVEFSEVLAANTTSFTFPLPENELLTWPKDVVVTVEAVDEDGVVFITDGFAFQADKFCTPEEIAAAGTGPTGAARSPAVLALAVLLAFGSVLAFGGVALARGRT